MSPSGVPQREGLKIRHYIFNIILRHPGESVKIPSSWELAKHFGVARSTVTLALKEMTDEGLLVGKPGVGTFVSPQYSRGIGNIGLALPLVGIVVAGGNNFCYGNYHWPLMASVGNHLVNRNFQVRPVTLSQFEPEAMKAEIKQNFLDALVWIGPPCELLPVIIEVNRMLPVVLVDRRTDEVNTIYIDYEEESYQLGRKLLAEGRKKFFAVNMHGSEFYMRGFQRAYAEAGCGLDERFIFDIVGNDPLCELAEALRAGHRPDALFLHHMRRVEVVQLLLEAGIDLKRECRIITSILAAEIPGFAGWCHQPPFEEMGAVALEVVSRMLGGDCRVEKQIVKTKEIPVNLD